ncbi:hypothetical protein C9374_002685 [Naegleria lovaniensis]|uniref:Ubiquitin-ribosomal protein eL40 fusion protein n=1 Tax=Naegleria lovaniensis TaxID=51637 RepID=A0AA88GV08_NAELO|nr:uncharacterized protein C9374_002685 [Naegleria lovaniensis]KAG2386239.1 hypothetical protein C9374_002685 [Naegleria lovaniensis]
MQIFVKSVTGKTLTLQIERNDHIEKIKSQISEKENIPTCQQRLLFGGKPLQDLKTVLDYDIQQESTIHLLLSLKGGKKKKRKKRICVVPRPKIHRHKNIVLLPITTNIYEIRAKDGFIICNRRTCPKCGPGVLMASHENRQYCGRCHLSLFHSSIKTSNM